MQHFVWGFNVSTRGIKGSRELLGSVDHCEHNGKEVPTAPLLLAQTSDKGEPFLWPCEIIGEYPQTTIITDRIGRIYGGMTLLDQVVILFAKSYFVLFNNQQSFFVSCDHHISPADLPSPPPGDACTV